MRRVLIILVLSVAVLSMASSALAVNGPKFTDTTVSYQSVDPY